MKKEIKVLVNNLNRRKGPSTSNAKLSGQLNKGDVREYTEKKTVNNEIWYKLTDGSWICGYLPSKGKYVEDNDQKEANKTDTSKPATSDSDLDKNVTDQNSGVKTNEAMDKAIEQMMIESNQEYLGRLDPDIRTLGQPYQFLSSTDIRPEENSKYGRKYLECVTSESPIVTIIPGKPNYLPDISKEDKASLTNAFTNSDPKSKEANNIIADILGMSEPRYFGFLADYEYYIEYVNALNRITSIYLGIENLLAPDAISTTYGRYNWANYKYRDAKRRTNKRQDSILHTAFQAFKDAAQNLVTDVTTPDYVSFYVDPNTSFSESANNSTNKSMVESSLFDTFGQMSKELSFFLNSGGAGMADSLKQGIGDAITSIGQSQFTKTGGMLDRLLTSAGQLIEGGNIIFPEIWSDSSYGKDYTFNMTFSAPYGHVEAIMNNVLAPFNHVLALALPRQTSANSFTSPFLLKAFAPGWFVCEMGICTSLSIEKTQWTVTGLPMEIKVSMGVRDLYSQLMITPAHKPGMLTQNTSLLNFLAVNAGVDLLEPDFKLKVKTILKAIEGAFVDAPGNFWRKNLVESLQNLFMRVFSFN